MNISSESKYTIYKHTGQYGPNYSIGLFKKDKDGNYENGYMPCRFQKNEELEDRTQIYIKEAWLTFNLKKEGNKDKTYPYIFINKYETIEKKLEESREVLEEKDEYEMFAEEIDIADDLPF